MAFMAFGGGRRICVGVRLALLELKLTLAQIGRRYTMHVCDKTAVGGRGKCAYHSQIPFKIGGAGAAQPLESYIVLKKRIL